jgi:hypothetical protein
VTGGRHLRLVRDQDRATVPVDRPVAQPRRRRSDRERTWRCPECDRTGPLKASVRERWCTGRGWVRTHRPRLCEILLDGEPEQ